MITIKLTNSDARHLHDALSQVAGFSELRAELSAKLEHAAKLEPSLAVRCYQCRQVQGSERAYVGHLIEMHHYVDDPYGEDTAQTEAWQAFHQS